MKEKDYRALLSAIRSRKGLAAFAVYSGKAITYLVYLFYPLFFVHLLVTKDPAVYKYVLVPGISFGIVSVVRYWLNFPRPYEKWDIEPLYHKKTSGKSFPSRHTFSVFMIAIAAFYLYPAIGIAIGIMGILLAISRVLCGVHFIRDVSVGMLCGIAMGLIGFYLL